MHMRSNFIDILRTQTPRFLQDEKRKGEPRIISGFGNLQEENHWKIEEEIYIFSESGKSLEQTEKRRSTGNKNVKL